MREEEGVSGTCGEEDNYASIGQILTRCMQNGKQKEMQNVGAVEASQ